MNVIIQHTEMGRFAHIETQTADINVPLDDRLPTVQCLRQYAASLRDKANMCIAEIVSEAAECYEHGCNLPMLH